MLGAIVLALTGVDASAARFGDADEARRAAAKARAIAAARAEAVSAQRAAEERYRAAGGQIHVMTPSRPPVDTVAAGREALLFEDETHHRFLGMIERLEQIAFATDDDALRFKVAALRVKAERPRQRRQPGHGPAVHQRQHRGHRQRPDALHEPLRGVEDGRELGGGGRRGGGRLRG